MHPQLETVFVLFLLFVLIVINVVGNNDTTCTQFRLLINATQLGVARFHNGSLAHLSLTHRSKFLEKDKLASISWPTKHNRPIPLPGHDQPCFTVHIAYNKSVTAEVVCQTESSLVFDHTFSELLKSTNLSINKNLSGSLWDRNITQEIADKFVLERGLKLILIESLHGEPRLRRVVFEEACVTTAEPTTSLATSASSGPTMANSTTSEPTSLQTKTSMTVSSSSTDYGTITSTAILTNNSANTSTLQDSVHTSPPRMVTSTPDGHSQATKGIKKRKEKTFSTTADKVYSAFGVALIVFAITNFVQMNALMQQ